MKMICLVRRSGDVRERERDRERGGGVSRK